MAENNPFVEEAVEAEAVIESNAVGVAVALDEAKADPAMSEKVGVFLDKQSALIDVQMHHLHEQFRQLRLKLWSDRLRLLFQGLTVLAGLAVAGVLITTVWEAHEADGVVIDAFSVPPTQAQRGLTGEAVARRLMDDLDALSDTAASPDKSRGVLAGWDKSITIEIPETGLSVTGLDKWLRDKLGHETHISGELIASEDHSLTLVARDGPHGLPVLTGGEAQVTDMIQHTAEAIFGQEQPRTYYLYLMKQSRVDEARAFVQSLTTNPSAFVQAFAYNAIGNIDGRRIGAAAAADGYRQAIEIEPDFVYPLGNLASDEIDRGHVESGYQLLLRAVSAASVPNPIYYSQRARLQILARSQGLAAAQVGDYQTASSQYLNLSRQTLLGNPSAYNTFDAVLAVTQASLHDIGAAKTLLAAYERQAANDRSDALEADLSVRISAEDWAGAVVAADAMTANLDKTTPDHGRDDMEPITDKAIALAHLRRISDAEAVIGPTALDCQPCVVARGVIAALKGDGRAADQWFGQAARQAPSLPFADLAWGQALLAQGQADRAIAQFKQADIKAPHFADPLEGWGEALMKKGDARGAAAKFAQAARFAPHWGDNHLRWGLALAALGKASDATIQFNAARRMDLSPDDQAVLAKLN